MALRGKPDYNQFDKSQLNERNNQLDWSLDFYSIQT